MWPLENLADSNSDKKGKLRQERINEIPAKKKKKKLLEEEGGAMERGYSANLEKRPRHDEHQAV